MVVKDKREMVAAARIGDDESTLMTSRSLMMLMSEDLKER